LAFDTARTYLPRNFVAGPAKLSRWSARRRAMGLKKTLGKGVGNVIVTGHRSSKPGKWDRNPVFQVVSYHWRLVLKKSSQFYWTLLKLLKPLWSLCLSMKLPIRTLVM